MVSSRKPLTVLQQEVIDAFFKLERAFYLTGGAALAGYYLHHRPTSDLDLFTADRDSLERGRRAVRELASNLGASVTSLNESATFQRYALERGPDEAVLVDLVVDEATALTREKPEVGGVRLDPPNEILANKLTALVGRQEERDLVDAFCLERAGYLIEDNLDAALAKDGGCTPATLAWLLGTFPLPAEDRLPASVQLAELAGWRDALVVRLRRLALP